MILQCYSSIKLLVNSIQYTLSNNPSAGQHETIWLDNRVIATINGSEIQV